jgi:hypothetical protein
MTETPAPPATAPDDRPLGQQFAHLLSTIYTAYRGRIWLTLAGLLALAVFSFASNAFHIPFHRGYDDSLVHHPSPAVAFLVTAACLFASVVIGTIVAGHIRFDAGLCAACVGLLTFSLRAGPLRYVLFDAASPAVYLSFFVELVLVYALVGAASFLQTFFHSLGFLRDDVFRDGLADTEDPLSDKLQAAFVQTLVMAFVVYFVAQNDQKNQVLFAVGLGSFLGTTLAHHLYPVRPSFWFWIGPLVVGSVGYLWAYASPAPDLIIGSAPNPLARALPVDYASVGPAAAIIAYWYSRRRKRDEVAQNSTDETPPQTPPAPTTLPPRPTRFDADRD